MPRPTTSHGRTGRPALTSRPQIMAAARQLIDRDGWDKLTIRRLATELGVGATTLYHHVRDREDLLLQLLNDQAAQAERPELPDEPRERIVVAATALHDALADWPGAAEVLTVDGFVGMLADTSLWTVETIVAGATDAGCTQEQAVDVFRSIWYYTVGEILVRTRSGRQPAHNVDFGNFDDEQLPTLAAIGSQWPRFAARDTYPMGLRAFVDGLLRHTAES